MRIGGSHLLNLIGHTWPIYICGVLAERPPSHQIGPNSMDLTLGDTFLLPVPDDEHVIDPYSADTIQWEPWEAPNDATPFRLQPGAMALGCVREAVDCSAPIMLPEFPVPVTCVSRIDGRSTVGRMGLQVHLTAAYGDYGFSGAYTLELLNCMPRPVLLYPGMRIAQISFDVVSGPLSYIGAYQSEDHRFGPIAPKFGRGRFV